MKPSAPRRDGAEFVPSPDMTAEAGVAHAQDLFFLEQTRPPSSRLWALSNDRMTIGRDPSSDVFIDDSGVSRHHADLVRRGPDWSIIDAGSTNGMSINGASVREMTLRPADRIKLGGTELIVRHSGMGSPDRQGDAARYDIGAQMGNNINVGGNYYQRQEGNLRYIASLRGRARRLIISGVWLFFIGSGLGLYAVLSFDNSVFNSISSSSFNPPSLPPQFIPMVGLGAFLNLLGIVLFIFGLVARSGAKREARMRKVDWS